MTAKTATEIPEYLENNRYVRDIVRLLERLTYRGRRTYEIFDDWLGICYHTLRMMPAHLRHAAEHGKPADDDAEAAAHWTRLRGLYERQDFREFQEAFHLLTGSAKQLPNVGDVLGDVYMAFAYPNTDRGQFFTPWHICQVMVDLGGVEEGSVFDRIKAAITSGDSVNHVLAQSALLVGLGCQTPAEARDWFVQRVAPLAFACGYEPITVYDPACGSGRMFVAAAAQLPAWMTQMPFVTFWGQDVDYTCVMMAQVNVMLSGLKGYAVTCQAAMEGVTLPAAPAIAAAAAATEPEPVAMPAASTFVLKPGARGRKASPAQLSFFD